MTSETKSDVPKLDPSNYGAWLLALRALTYNSDSFENLTGDPQPPIDPAALPNSLQKRNYLLGKIIATIPSDISNLLISPDSEPTPFALVTAIKAHFNNLNANDHRYVKCLAEAAHFLPDMTLPDYITAHEKIRAKMIASRYPNISNPTTTVALMIEGLQQNPRTVNIGLQVLSIQPSDMKDFTHHFSRIQAYQDITAAIPQALGLPRNQSSEIHDILHILRNTARTAQESHTRSHFRNPCKFHLSKGVRNPRHTESQCRDPLDPRNPQNCNLVRLSSARATQSIDDDTLIGHLQNMAANAPTEDNNDTESTFIIDPAADPTHLRKPTPDMTPLDNPIITHMATNHASK